MVPKQPLNVFHAFLAEQPLCLSRHTNAISKSIILWYHVRMKYMRTFIQLRFDFHRRFFIVLLFLALSTKLYAENAPLKLVTLPFPPWGFYDQKNNPVGVGYDMASAIAERMGRTYVNRIVPMSRVFKEIEYGSADITIVLRTPYSEAVAVPVTNLSLSLRAIIWPRKGISIKSTEDLSGLRLSMPIGMKMGKEFTSIQKNLNIMPTIDYPKSLQMFRANRIDAIIGTEQSLLYNAIKSGMNPYEEFGTPYEISRYIVWVHASKKFIAHEGLEKLQSVAQSLKDDGTFASILKKYNYPIPTTGPIPKNLPNIR